MRTDPQPAADERTTLVEFLEFHRETVLLTVAGPTSTCSASWPTARRASSQLQSLPGRRSVSAFGSPL
jgi:hypothetical protein